MRFWERKVIFPWIAVNLVKKRVKRLKVEILTRGYRLVETSLILVVVYHVYVRFV